MGDGMICTRLGPLCETAFRLRGQTVYELSRDAAGVRTPARAAATAARNTTNGVTV